jgi:hypothetical protein
MNIPEQAHWQYERGEGRHKHCWAKDEAGFHPSPKGLVGKCHASITNDIAVNLLRNGVVYYAPGSLFVEHVYAVYRGTIYEAAPTRIGESFHGYPWRGDLGGGGLPPRILRRLRDMATRQGCIKEFEQWLTTYGK